MNLSPQDRKAFLDLLAERANRELRAAVDYDTLATIELSTAAQMLGISTKQAGRILPVVEVGPRTRRVTVAAYKAALAERTKQPARPTLP